MIRAVHLNYACLDITSLSQKSNISERKTSLLKFSRSRSQHLRKLARRSWLCFQRKATFSDQGKMFLSVTKLFANLNI